MEKLKKMNLQTRLTAVILAVMLLLTTLVAVIVPQINSVDAADVPGTQAYYDARWEESKVKAGNLAVGTAYTDYQGNAATTTTEGPWKLDIDYSTCSAPWNSTAVAPTVGAGTVASPYQVTTAEQYRYCLVNRKSFKLMKDIDLGGYLGRNWTKPPLATNTWVADGNGHTVYNYYGNFLNTVSPSMFGITSNVTVKNIQFLNCYHYTNRTEANNGFEHVYGGALILAGWCGDISADLLASNIKFQNVVVGDSMAYGTGHLYATSAMLTNVKESTLENCYAKNTSVAVISKDNNVSCCCIMAENCNDTTLTNCYAVDSIVIGNVGHNGGLFSCGANYAAENCFADINVYGNTRAGVLFGVVDSGNLTLKNCYSTGKIEGTSTIGGFGGMLAPGETNITNCYSSAMVGLVINVTNSGGLIGNMPGTSANIVNSYAVGEVGGVDTNSSTAAAARPGGFIGSFSNTTFTNSFYDKQTTAMREWASGSSQNVSGITGMLTTTSTKSGKGMTDANWTALGGAYNNSLGDGYYPQLTVFSNPTTFTNTNWMSQEELNNLVKAYSQASVSTVKLDTYDKDYAGNALPTTTYDTVRDVTAKFPLTSDNNISWERCGVTGSATLATGTGAKSEAFTEIGSIAKDVIDLYKQGDTWYGDHPMPGVDWTRVSATVGNQTGTRALRICPRVGLEAGLSQTIGRGESYDHANDVQMVYSTGARMTDDNTNNDYTYGVYPDDPLESRQQQLLSASAFANLSALTTKYQGAGQNDAFSNIDALYMERTATDLATGVPTPTTATGGKLNEVKIYEVLSENSDGSVVLGNQIDLTNAAQADKWNGNTAFATDSVHKIYSVQYVWSLSDGRYVTDTKRIEYPKLTHNVSISVENVEGIKLSNKAFLDAYSVSTDGGKLDSSILPVLGSSTKKEDWLISQSHAHPAATSWKLDVGSEPMKEIRVTFHSVDGEVQKTVTVPAASLPQTAGAETSFEAIAPYRVYSYDSSGALVWNTFEMKKTYNITLDENGTYTIKFDKEFANYTDGVYVDDVDMDIDVVVVIDGEPPEKETVVFQFNNDREDKPWANGKMDVTNDMPDLN